MIPPRSTRFSALLALFVGSLLALTTPLSASEGGFGATLSLEQQSAAGLPILTAAERLVLDQLVAGELASVRKGEVPELTGTFVSRRTDAERTAAGLDRLSPAQLTKLNGLIAEALAVRPKPKERQRLKDSDVFNQAKPQIHGSVTMAYGWGAGGRDFWGSSLWLDYYDPEKGFGLSVGLSNFSGDGLFGYDPYYFGSRYYGGPLVYPDTFYRDGYRGDYFLGDGQSFRNQSDWGSFRHDFHRR